MKVYEMYSRHEVEGEVGFILAPGLWTWGKELAVCRLQDTHDYAMLDYEPSFWMAPLLRSIHFWRDWP